MKTPQRRQFVKKTTIAGEKGGQDPGRRTLVRAAAVTTKKTGGI